MKLHAIKLVHEYGKSCIQTTANVYSGCIVNILLYIVPTCPAQFYSISHQPVSSQLALEVLLITDLLDKGMYKLHTEKNQKQKSFHLEGTAPHPASSLSYGEAIIVYNKPLIKGNP